MEIYFLFIYIRTCKNVFEVFMFFSVKSSALNDNALEKYPS